MGGHAVALAEFSHRAPPAKKSPLKCLQMLRLHSLCMGWRNLPMLRVGWRNFFPVVMLCCDSFWFWREMRELALHYFLVDCFGIEREIVFGVTYVLSVEYSCVVVSVFLLWRESQFCSNTLQLRLFLKNIQNFLCKKNDPI